MVKIGLDGKLYRNTGTYAVPVWVEIDNAKDVTLNLEKGEADVTTRANNGWKATRGTLKDGSIEFEMVYDTEDENFTALQSAFFVGTDVEIAGMDGDIVVAGSQGLRATMQVMSFSRNEPLEEAMTVNVTLKPTYATHAPTWGAIGGGAIRLAFDVALDAGAGEIDLTAIPYGDGAYDGSGKAVTQMEVVNEGEGALTITAGVSNGYDLFAAGDDIVVPAGGSVRLAAAGGADVDGTHKILTLAGTGTEASRWALVLA